VPKKESGDNANTPANQTAAASVPGDAALAALFDPYGGVLNLSTGGYAQLPFLNVDEDHGLFVDARFGMKLLSLPDQAESAPTVLNSKVTPFYAGAVVLKLVRNLYDSGDGNHVAGGFELGLGYVVNVAADTTMSSVFSNGSLERATQAARIDLTVSLNSVAAINISWNPWSNTDFGKRFVVGLKLLNQNPKVDRSN
jgi:hypothetical protein